MSIYRLQTKVVRNRELTNFVCKVVNSDTLCQWVTDKIPEATEIREFLQGELEPIKDSDLAEILKSRLDRLGKIRSSIFLAFNEPDYLSSAFLERGLRCSAAVCLLKRAYWYEDLIEQIKDSSTNDAFEILQQVSERIGLLPAKHPGEHEDIWEKYERVSDALEDEVIKTKLGNFKKKLDELAIEDKHREGTIYISFATGFMVGKNYLITNFHVFNQENKNDIKNFVAQFRYEKNALGRNLETVDYQLDPDVFCISNEQLDYTIVQVKPLENYEKAGLRFAEAGENFGWLPMLADSTLIAPPISRDHANHLVKLIAEIDTNRIFSADLLGEPVFIIQHPQGMQKKIVLFNNRIQNIYHKFLQYEADADFGSSGSPLLNSQWQLVGLHHAALVRWNGEDIEVQGNLGTRVCEIVKHLETNRSQPGVADFLDNERYVVKRDRRLLKGTIYILVGYQRVGVPSLEHSSQEVTIAKRLLEKIIESSNEGFPVKDVLQEGGNDYSAGINYVNQQNYQIGDVAIEIRASFYPDELDRGTRVTIFYSDERPDHKAYAEIVLQALLYQVPQLSNIVQSSTAAPEIDLQFCKDVNMPSLVMSLDFLGMDFNQVMRKVDAPPWVQEPISEFDRGILDGLKSWVRVLSPIGFWDAD